MGRATAKKQRPESARAKGLTPAAFGDGKENGGQAPNTGSPGDTKIHKGAGRPVFEKHRNDHALMAFAGVLGERHKRMVRGRSVGPLVLLDDGGGDTATLTDRQAMSLRPLTDLRALLAAHRPLAAAPAPPRRHGA